jgi:hypothetical protein
LTSVWHVESISLADKDPRSHDIVASTAALSAPARPLSQFRGDKRSAEAPPSPPSPEVTMSLFPTASALSATFGTCYPHRFNNIAPITQSSLKAKQHLYPSWDVADKAGQLSDAATKELQKASDIAQAKAGKIELYSGKYYAVSRGRTSTQAVTEANIVRPARSVVCLPAA